MAMFAPLNPHPTDEGAYERLGCCASSLAQVLYFNRRCPTGSVEYTVPGYEATGMDFDAAAESGLCDWSRLAGRPLNSTTDPGTSAVARYIYATALVVERRWGSPKGVPHYLLDHDAQDAAVSRHYGVDVSRFHIAKTEAARAEAESLLVEELDHRRPVIAFLVWLGLDQRGGPEASWSEAFLLQDEASLEAAFAGHLVVLDGYRRANSRFEVHMNAGQDGFNNGWYDFDETICFARNKNGTPTEHLSGCAHRFDHVSYLKFVRPRHQLEP